MEKGKDGGRKDRLLLFYLLFPSFVLSMFSFPLHPPPPSSLLLLPHHYPCPVPPFAICSIPASPAEEQEPPVPGSCRAPAASQECSAGNAELPPAPARAAAPQKQPHAALRALGAFRLHRGQADTGSQDSPRGTGALIRLLSIIPAQLARTKRYFLLNQQGQAVNTRDPPDLQELCVNAWPQPPREGCGQGQEHRVGRAFEESCYIYFFFSCTGGRNLPLEKLILQSPDAFKIKNNGPHDKPSAAFTTKEVPDVFYSLTRAFTHFCSM